MPSPEVPKKSFHISPYWWYMVFIILFLFLYQSIPSVKEITWQDFANNMLKRHAVEKIQIVNHELAEVFIKKSFSTDTTFSNVFKNFIGKGIHPGPHYTFTIGSVESFENKLEAAQKDFLENEKMSVVYVKRTHFINDILPWLIPIVLLVFFWQYASRSMRANGDHSVFNFGKSTATLFKKEDTSKITFNDVAGLDEAKVEIKEIVDFLKDPQAYTRLGAQIPKGVIIVGPPGTGKTLLAKAVAGEAQVPFFSVSGSAFVEMFVGVGASRVRDLFSKAKEKSPSIIFIDEIDAVGRSRGKNTFYTGANDERESTLNQLLTEMDGFGTNSGVIVLAATNRADMLDPALLRPGRFDRHIYLELPTLAERIAIFKVHLKPLLLEASIDIPYMAAQVPGSSGADIANICNEAALIAARRKKKKVDHTDFVEAIDRIVSGIEKKSKIISQQEKNIIAYHEAGHAVVSWYLKEVDPLVKVSIVPRGKSLGAAWYLPEEHQLRNVTQFTQMLCASLGGRAAEEIIFGDVTSGALDDLEKVTKMAYTMVAYYGFNKEVGHISFYDSSGINENGFQKPYSEETARIIDEQVRKLVADVFLSTKNILLSHRQELKKMAESLLEKEVLYKEDIEKILGSRGEEKKEVLIKLA